VRLSRRALLAGGAAALVTPTAPAAPVLAALSADDYVFRQADFPKAWPPHKGARVTRVDHARGEITIEVFP
jgi:hypothetical protein